ncbi:MAG: DNA cytosine methyltransferase, partial [Metamycoplasmataceae bacterium]
NSNTRSSLLWEIGRILTELKEKNKLPKFLLLENVPNMISSRHMPEYIKWKKFLFKLGYKTKTYKHSAYDHGIPQIRKRVYAISILDSNLQFDKKEYEIKDCDALPNKLPKEDRIKKKELKDIIKDDYSKKKYREEALKANPNRTISRQKMFYENFVLNGSKKHKYARTLTTRQDRHPNAGVIDLKGTKIECKDLSKAKYRFLTTREAYLLMGFDEKDYDRVKKQNIKESKLYQQAGNSIVVNAIIPVIKKIQELNNE